MIEVRLDVEFIAQIGRDLASLLVHVDGLSTGDCGSSVFGSCVCPWRVSVMMIRGMD
jgi:hypothetical protein